jgi:hypothetical protein
MVGDDLKYVQIGVDFQADNGLEESMERLD